MLKNYRYDADEIRVKNKRNMIFTSIVLIIAVLVFLYSMKIIMINSKEEAIRTDPSAAIKEGDLNVLNFIKYNDRVSVSDQGILISNGGLIYGPYVNLDSGDYIIEMECRYDESAGKMSVKITSDSGKTVLDQPLLISGENIIRLSLEEDEEGIEIVLENEIFDDINISKIILRAEASGDVK